MIIETWFLPPWPKNVPSFLMMHAVNDETGIYLDHGTPIGDNNYIRPSELEGFIRYAQHKGYRFSTFREAIEHPRPYTMAMTFDDGYVDSWTNLLPLLQRLQVPATCFVTNLGLSDPTHFLSVDQIRGLDRSGLVEIGGHTAHHTFLKSVSHEVAWDEIIENKRYLEETLGHEIVSFCYPRGEETDEIVDLVKAAGYRYGAAMVKKMRPVETDLYRIHRQILPRGISPRHAYLLATRGKYKI